MNVLGLSYGYHDAAAALLVDGDLQAAAEEERFSRVKHDAGFPNEAIHFCLSSADLNVRDIDMVAFYERPLLKLHRTFTILGEQLLQNPRYAFRELTQSFDRQLRVRRTIIENLQVAPEQVLFVPHHLSHAASAFLCSPFDTAAILTIDGVGEWSTTTVSQGCRSPRNSAIDLIEEIKFPHSLGLLYSAFTQFCGFDVNDGEYKLMGLAPYGDASHIDRVRSIVDFRDDGSFELKMEYFDFHRSNHRMYSKKFVELFGDPSRRNRGEIDPFYADIAASIQAVIEDGIIALASRARDKTKETNICLAGGVAHNSVAIGRLVREGIFDQIFIQPAAGDAGGALGAALYVDCIHFGNNKAFTMRHASWGSQYTDKAIADALSAAGLKCHSLEADDDIADATSELLMNGDIVGLHQGRFEWGPRALGNRSIIADPRSANTKERINEKVKFREQFRPFAPAILQHRATEFIQFLPSCEPLSCQFMTTVHPYRDGMGEAVPAVNHCGTARIQAVGDCSPTRFRKIIEAFESKTDIPVLLNTSFNLRGEPIVESPQQTIRTYLDSGLDALMIGRYLVRKSTESQIAVPLLHEDLGTDSAKTHGRDVLPKVQDLVPAIAGYNAAKQYVRPHLFHINGPNQSTSSLNTDRIGFRHSTHGQGVIDCDNWSKQSRRGLVIGGSCAFGFGATYDDNTVPSILAAQTGISFLNVGINGATSTHEVQACQYFSVDAEVIIWFSGYNNLHAAIDGSVGRAPFSPVNGESVIQLLESVSSVNLTAALLGRDEEEAQDKPRLRSIANIERPDDLRYCARVAAEAYSRDLHLVRRLASEDCRLIFALQPIAHVAKRRPTPEELELLELHRTSAPKRLNIFDEKIPSVWPIYTELLQNICADLNIEFIDLNEMRYPGTCFIDPVHMTDLGYETATKHLANLLC